MSYEDRDAQRGLLENYDLLFGASATPDPNFFAILLMLYETLNSFEVMSPQRLGLKIQNPWLNLIATVAAGLDIPDEFSLPEGLCYDHRFHNMLAALALLRYTKGRVTRFRESVLLASFLQSREFAISSVALEYYMKTILSCPRSSTPPCHLSGAVCAVFNVMLPDYQLRRGWSILEVFVDKFGDLPVEWSRAFTEGFFTLSRRPLPQSQGETEATTPGRELMNILTWDYFHAEEQESELTDSEFSGLDWMAMAWSLQLSH